jgi:cystathionine gamma-synthase
VIAADGYGVTRALLEQLGRRDGVEVSSMSFTGPDMGVRLANTQAKLVVCESVTNPLLQVPDLPMVAAAARAAGSRLAVDGTFPSPLGQRTLGHGADYAIQSTTKWINGHSDALGGTVSGSRVLIDPLRSARVLNGDIMGPFEAWLTLRGLRTLPVRLRTHGAHALALAKTLEGAPGISRVWYPGLPSHPQHVVAARVLDTSLAGFGGMLAFELTQGTRERAFRFLESVKLARPAPSLGDVSTLVMHAASAAARKLTPEQRAAAGITEGLIRVSVGLEDPGDLSDDLLNAVRFAAQGATR